MCDSFGGGLGRFRESSHVSNSNLCRELVEVEGGTDWKIRKLEEKYEEICWKYPGSSVIVNYHMNRLQNLEEQESFDENLKIFYAKVSHFVSPVEISLQPKYLRSARQGIHRQMNAFYNSTCLKFQKDQIFPGVACAAKESDVWYRAKIVQVSGDKHIVVELVDIGIQHLIPSSSIQPLLRRFGRAPPLSLKCRVDGVSINDLETKDLIDFKKIVENCNALFRVELKSTIEPFLIDLLHPTISNRNVCQKFMPPPEDLGKIERLDRNWIQHCRKVCNEVDDDEDDIWNHNWAGDRNNENDVKQVTSIKIIHRLAKCQKAPRFDTDQLLVGHIENSQIIYLHYPWQLKTRHKIENHLKDSWETLPVLSQNLVEDQIYAVILHQEKTRKYRRAIYINQKSLLLLDYGIYIEMNCDNILLEIRLLPDDQLFKEPPMLTIISLAGANVLQPAHHSETQVLRNIMKNDDIVYFQWDGKSKNTPMRGFLYTSDRQNISTILSETLLKNRQNIGCRQLVKQYFKIPTTYGNSNHIYRNSCHQSYSKGALLIFPDE
ncbi:unnamed protein product [Caenorhabditis angaria]|uniref:Tudor domain-containing protein n=1 Tax=Caenorhabditis angaria TaxID=860376 RepID=A0A9P1IUX7_9PELO|nr:unnamed protein product [Caenorhabditis angaria]